MCDAGGVAYLLLLAADELQEEWCGLAEIADLDLKLWQEPLGADLRPPAPAEAIQHQSSASGRPSRHVFESFKARKQQAAWFFEILWSEEWRAARCKVLKFTTGLVGSRSSLSFAFGGSDRWPRDPKSFVFYVEPMDGGDELLPRAMTCGNMLQLPSYSSKAGRG